jgi:methanogenic corrinoid protein MtbC1
MRPMAAIQQQEGLPIAAVEQATGIARATLRIWERRYGFPQPGRDGRGERTYPEDQVRKLQQVAALMELGHRPGRLVQMTDAQLASLEGAATGDLEAARAALPEDPVLAPLRNHDPVALVLLLEESVRTMGLAGFVTERMPQMNAVVGQAWSCGGLEVFEEHLYTECVQQLLRVHIAGLPTPTQGRPRVLLATLPEETHGLGLLMAQAVLALEGCACTSLGVRVPASQVVSACAGFRPDIVGVSFSACANPAHVHRALEQLRAELPASVALWAGGGSSALARRRFPGVQRVAHIREVPALVAQWRAGRTSPA